MSPSFSPNALCVNISAPHPTSIPQYFQTAADSAAGFLCDTNDGQDADTTTKSPWGSELAKEKGRWWFFLMPKPVPGKWVPVVTCDAHILLGSWVSMPGLFVILQLIACLSEAFHSFLLPRLWPSEGFATLQAKSPSPRFSEAGSPWNCISRIPVSPSALCKERAFCYSSKSSRLNLDGRLGSKSWYCSSPEHYFPLNHQHAGLSRSWDRGLPWSLWEKPTQLW